MKFVQRHCVDPTNLAPQHAHRLFLASFLTIPSILVALGQGLYDCAWVPLAVFFTSVNYWRNPRYGLRRQLDMLTVAAGTMYNLTRSHESDHCVWYLFTCVAVVLCYFIARATPNPHISTMWHVGIHVCANIGNILLYVGLDE